MAVYEINEAQNNANKVNTKIKILLRDMLINRLKRLYKKKAAKAVEKTAKLKELFA